MALVALATGACVAGDGAADDDLTVATAAEELQLGAGEAPRYHQVQQAATHNSYWVQRDNVTELEASGTQERILDQLLFDHVRTLELDVHKDNPHPGNFTVYHTDKESNSFCSPLAECLKQLQLFQYAMPQHEVVTLVVELKEFSEYNFDDNHTPAHLDAIFEQYLGPWLYRPRDFLARCSGSDMRACAQQASWPTIPDLRGKFIVAVLGNWRHELPALGWTGHGPAGWVTYATWGGGVRDRTGFPMESYWIHFNEGPSTDTVDPGLLDAARRASVFMQVEQEQIDAPQVADYLAQNLVIRAGGANDSFADQQHRRERGAQIIQTDYPWLQINDRGQRQPFRLVPSVTAADESALQEPGQRLLLKQTAAGDQTVFAYTVAPPSGQSLWETIPSTTRPSPNGEYANPRHTRATGCLRAATGYSAQNGNGDSVSVCRHTFDGNWWTSNPVGEDAIITIELVRNGQRTTQTWDSANRTAGGPGDYVRMYVNNNPSGQSCASLYTASVMGGAEPSWVPLAMHCFSQPLVMQGLSATSGDVLFSGTKRLHSNGMRPVAATELTTPVRLMTGGGSTAPGYTLLELSWPGPAASCPRNGPGACLNAVHRSYGNSQHFYTNDLVEGSSWGFDLELANYYYVESAPRAGVVPLYRCYLPGVNRRFYTTSPTCEDAGSVESVLGQIATSPEPGTVPLYRAYSPSTSDHFYATSWTEMQGAISQYGYTYEGVTGYVWPQPSCPRNAAGACLTAVHRSVGPSQHFYTTNLWEASTWGFELEIASFFHLESTWRSGRRPLYRCYRSAYGKRFYSADPGCENAGVNEGLMGYMAIDPEPGTVPLYRSYSPAGNDHLYTTSWAEVQSASSGWGYNYEFSPGYVWPQPTL